MDPHYGDVIDLRDFRFSLGCAFLGRDSTHDTVQGWEDELLEDDSVEVIMTRVLRNNKHRIGNRSLPAPK